MGRGFSEHLMNPDDEFTQEWMTHDNGFYMWSIVNLLKVVSEHGTDEGELMDAHKEAVVGVMEDIADVVESRFGDANPGVVQAVLTAMVGTSLLATFDQQMDHIMFQIDVMRMERGEDDGR